MKTRLSLSLGLLAAAIAAQSHAETTAGAVFVNPAINYTVYDADDSLDNDYGWQLGAEYMVTDDVGVELFFSKANPDVNADGESGDADDKRWGVNALYYFETGTALEPYVLAGIANQEYDFSVSDEDGSWSQEDDSTVAQLGGGLRYFFTDNFSVRTDVRAVNSLDEEDTHAQATFGFSYNFGGAKKAAPVAAPSTYCTQDEDGDGVCNEKDQCPGTAAGVQVDANGCPAKLTRTESMNLHVNFANDSSVVDGKYMPNIQKAADFMKKYSTVNADIEGHTDSNASDAYNQKLSQKRADAVKGVLVSKYGVASNRLKAVGYGESRPVTSNATAAGRAENRRVMATFKAESSN